MLASQKLSKEFICDIQSKADGGITSITDMRGSWVPVSRKNKSSEQQKVEKLEVERLDAFLDSSRRLSTPSYNFSILAFHFSETIFASFIKCFLLNYDYIKLTFMCFSQNISMYMVVNASQLDHLSHGTKILSQFHPKMSQIVQ